MPKLNAAYELVTADNTHAVVRTLRRTTVAELCSALGFSRGVRYEVTQEGRLARMQSGEAVRLQQDLVAGEDLVLTLARPKDTGALSDRPVDVVWQDRFVLAANKPAGLLVHGDGTDADTLTARVQGMLARAAEKEGWTFAPKAQAVNRLDVETSGIVLFSLTQEFQPALDGLIATHDTARIRKRYLAVVEGEFPQGVQDIDAPIGRDRHVAQRMRVAAPGKGKPAQTRVARLDCRAGMSLVACQLLSGRRHQIRVHLAHVGHPIAGDSLYGTASKGDPSAPRQPRGRDAHSPRREPSPLGDGSANDAIPHPVRDTGGCRARTGKDSGGKPPRAGRKSRPNQPPTGLMLHAAELEFVHPVTCEQIRLTTEWPDRFAGLFSPRTVNWCILD